VVGPDTSLKTAARVEREDLRLRAPVHADTSAPEIREQVGRRADRAVIASPRTARRSGLSVVAGALLVVILAIFLGAYVYERTRLTPDTRVDAGGPSRGGALADNRTGDRAREDAAAGRGEAATTGDLPRVDAATREADQAGAPAPAAPPPVPPEAAAPPPVPPPSAAEATPQPAEQRSQVPGPAESRDATARQSEPAPLPSPLPSDARPPSPDQQTRGPGARESLEPNAREKPAPPAEDLSGEWTLVTRVEASSIPSFQGLELGYRVRFAQHGNAIEGTGAKVSENGRTISTRGQTPIVLNGTVAGERVTLTFTEDGTRRRSSGRFVLVREDGAAWRGRFSSDAARSSGTVLARRAE
jgi:hypothetical protein